MKKILLIQPAHQGNIVYRFKNLIFRNLFGLKSMDKKIFMYPLTLSLIAGLTPECYKVEIIDENVEPIDFEKKVDIVGITSLTPCASRAYKIADEFRNRKIPVVIGGSHPTAMPEEALLHADAVVVGEADSKLEDGRFVWHAVLEDIFNGRKGFIYKGSNHTPLEEIPWPRRDLVQSDKYAGLQNIETTRGCPYKCEFCSANIVFGPYRFRSIESVISEMRKELEKNDKQAFFFTDNNFLAKPSRTEKLLKKMIELRKEYQFYWACQGDLTATRSQNILDMAGESGCLAILIGFESLSSKNIEVIGKKRVNKVELYSQQINAIHKSGIYIIGGFIFGQDYDNEDIFSQTAKFIKENNIEVPQLTIYTPFPGTPLYEKLLKEGRIITKNWDLYTTHCGIIKPKLMSWEDMMRGLEWIGRKVYSTKEVLKRMLKAKYLRNGGAYKLKMLSVLLANQIYKKYLSNGLKETASQIGKWN